MRRATFGELAARVGITPANPAVLKNGRAKTVRFATLAAPCEVLGLPTRQPAVLGARRHPTGRLDERAASKDHTARG